MRCVPQHRLSRPTSETLLDIGNSRTASNSSRRQGDRRPLGTRRPFKRALSLPSAGRSGARDTSAECEGDRAQRLTRFESRAATVYRRVTLSFAAALEAIRAPLRSRRIASERVISSRFAHRSMALIVSGGSRTLINGSASVVRRPFLDWTVFGMTDPLLNRVRGATSPSVHCMEQAEIAIPRSDCEDPSELIRYASTFVLLPTVVPLS
jgi:hypothetical protein